MRRKRRNARADNDQAMIALLSQPVKRFGNVQCLATTDHEDRGVGGGGASSSSRLAVVVACARQALRDHARAGHEQRLVRAPSDPACNNRSAILGEVGEPELGAIPWHLGVIPAGEG